MPHLSLIRTIAGSVLAGLVIAPWAALASTDPMSTAAQWLMPNASLCAVFLAVPALYLLRGPFDPRN